MSLIMTLCGNPENGKRSGCRIGKGCGTISKMSFLHGRILWKNIGMNSPEFTCG